MAKSKNPKSKPVQQTHAGSARYLAAPKGTATRLVPRVVSGAGQQLVAALDHGRSVPQTFNAKPTTIVEGDVVLRRRSSVNAHVIEYDIRERD